MDYKKFIKEKWFYIALLIIALALPWLVPNRYIFQIIIMACVFSIAALSLNLILGYTGQASLAHAGFFAIGAYGVGLMTKAGFSFWLALPLAALAAALVGLVIGIPTLRTRGAYFSISTLCFGVIITIVAGNWVALTGGHNGLVGIPRPTPINLPLLGELSFTSQTSQYYLVLVFLLLTLFIMHRLIHSPLGLSFMAVRNNEALAESVGINTFGTKLLSFMIANFFAGLAGGIYVSFLGSISPSAANLHVTFNWLVFVMLGGVATLAGPVIGTFGVSILMEYLHFLAEYRMLLFGALLIAVIIFFPKGFMGGYENLRQKIKNYQQQRKAGVSTNAAKIRKPDQTI